MQWRRLSCPVVVVFCACLRVCWLVGSVFVVGFHSVSFYARYFCVFVAGEQSRHVPVGVTNSRNARIDFSRCENVKSQVSLSVKCSTHATYFLTSVTQLVSVQCSALILTHFCVCLRRVFHSSKSYVLP